MSDIRAVAYELSNSDGETIIIRSERHQVESYKHRYSTDMVNELVRKSEAQTQIAARDAEIARLREAVTVIDSLIMGNSDPVAMFCGIHSECTKALKGGAA